MRSLIVILLILYIYHRYGLKIILKVIIIIFSLVNDIITLYIVVELQSLSFIFINWSTY